jgi:hypothetical protein
MYSENIEMDESNVGFAGRGQLPMGGSVNRPCLAAAFSQGSQRSHGQKTGQVKEELLRGDRRVADSLTFLA